LLSLQLFGLLAALMQILPCNLQVQQMLAALENVKPSVISAEKMKRLDFSAGKGWKDFDQFECQQK